MKLTVPAQQFTVSARSLALLVIVYVEGVLNSLELRLILEGYSDGLARSNLDAKDAKDRFECGLESGVLGRGLTYGHSIAGCELPCIRH